MDDDEDDDDDIAISLLAIQKLFHVSHTKPRFQRVAGSFP